MRILDLDLDFFLHGTAHDADPDCGERLDSDEYPSWDLEEAIEFLEQRCLLTEKLPGLVVEHHSEIFWLWGEAVARGEMVPPFSVAHLDAHADLGLGDAGYAYLMNELAFEPIQKRYGILEQRRPARREGIHLYGNKEPNDGNWLAFALACGWLSELIYVFNSEGEGRPGDLLNFLMKDFDFDSRHLQLCAVTHEDLQRGLAGPKDGIPVQRRDPALPFTWTGWPRFQGAKPFDFICLTRSPAYTPAASDAIYAEIRLRFIDETGPGV